MLYYCSEPRNESQIKSYCGIDSEQFDKFVNHCTRHDLIRQVVSEDEIGEFNYIVTDLGRQTLATAQEIMKALGITGSVLDGS